MLKRINIYFKEMFPLIPRLLLTFLCFTEIYFILLLNQNVTEFNLGIQEVVGAFTLFTFLLWLRIADDFKDYELDCRLFAHRPLPSGRVKKKDLVIVLAVLIPIVTVLNIIYMNNLSFFIFLYTYGFLMAMWFFQKFKIQKNLVLALVTHNPVQLIINLYIISFTCIKYDLPWISLPNALLLFTLYFPALMWEVSRKIRAPKNETEYVTYSKLFGYKRASNFVLIIAWVDIITNILLLWKLNVIGIVVLMINIAYLTFITSKFNQDPEKFAYVGKVELYTYIQESVMVICIPIFLIFGPIIL